MIDRKIMGSLVNRQTGIQPSKQAAGRTIVSVQLFEERLAVVGRLRSQLVRVKKKDERQNEIK